MSDDDNRSTKRHCAEPSDADNSPPGTQQTESLSASDMIAGGDFLMDEDDDMVNGSLMLDSQRLDVDEQVRMQGSGLCVTPTCGSFL